MKAEAVTAITAVAAVVLSLASLVWQWRISEGRKAWEAEQDRVRQRWAKEQQAAQNQWQEEQTRLQVERETNWREEEAQRLAAWRAEDVQRQEELRKPKLDVAINLGFQMNPVSGLSEVLVFTEARNVGVVPVYFSNWGGFVLPDERLMEWPRASNPSKYGTDYDFRRPLMPASSCKIYVEQETLKHWLAANGYSGVVEIRGYFSDRLGTNHVSNPMPIEVSDE